MQTLLVAPSSDLEYAVNEVQNVANALRPRMLMGHVTLAQVVQELQRTEYDVVWFACHGDADGIRLSDEALTPPMLAQLLRSCPPKMLFLNTCSSFNVAMVVHDSVNTPVMGTICDVPDRDAFVTGSVAARVIERQIANGHLDVGAVYQESKPGQNRQYILLNGSVRLGGEDKQDDLLQMMLYMMKRQDELTGTVVTETAALRQEMRQRYQPRLGGSQALAWLLAYFIFTSAALLFNQEVAGALSLRWPVAFGIVVIIDLLAALLFMWGVGFPMPPWGEKDGS